MNKVGVFRVDPSATHLLRSLVGQVKAISFSGRRYCTAWRNSIRCW